MTKTQTHLSLSCTLVVFPGSTPAIEYVHNLESFQTPGRIIHQAVLQRGYPIQAATLQAVFSIVEQITVLPRGVHAK